MRSHLLMVAGWALVCLVVISRVRPGETCGGGGKGGKGGMMKGKMMKGKMMKWGGGKGGKPGKGKKVKSVGSGWHGGYYDDDDDDDDDHGGYYASREPTVRAGRGGLSSSSTVEGIVRVVAQSGRALKRILQESIDTGRQPSVRSRHDDIPHYYHQGHEQPRDHELRRSVRRHDDYKPRHDSHHNSRSREPDYDRRHDAHRNPHHSPRYDPDHGHSPYNRHPDADRDGYQRSPDDYSRYHSPSKFHSNDW